MFISAFDLIQHLAQRGTQILEDASLFKSGEQLPCLDEWVVIEKQNYIFAAGYVNAHPMFSNGTSITTSCLKQYCVNQNVVIIATENSKYILGKQAKSKQVRFSSFQVKLTHKPISSIGSNLWPSRVYGDDDETLLRTQ